MQKLTKLFAGRIPGYVIEHVSRMLWRLFPICFRSLPTQNHVVSRQQSDFGRLWCLPSLFSSCFQEILHAFRLPIVVVTRQHEHVVSAGVMFSKMSFPSLHTNCLTLCRYIVGNGRPLENPLICHLISNMKAIAPLKKRHLVSVE